MVLLGAAGLIRLRWPKVPRALRRELDVPIELRLRSLSRGGALSRPEKLRNATARERQLERMVPVRLYGDNQLMMRLTLTTPAPASCNRPTPIMVAWIQLSASGRA